MWSFKVCGRSVYFLTIVGDPRIKLKSDLNITNVYNIDIQTSLPWKTQLREKMQRKNNPHQTWQDWRNSRAPVLVYCFSLWTIVNFINKGDLKPIFKQYLNKRHLKKDLSLINSTFSTFNKAGENLIHWKNFNTCFKLKLGFQNISSFIWQRNIHSGSFLFVIY